MKIIVVNKFYYNRGGDCIATFALEKALRDAGHQVAVFSMNHPLNIKSEWSGYFVDEVSFSSPGIGKIRALLRLFYPLDVKEKFIKLIDDFSPDIVHLNNIHSYISPLVAEIAHERNIKVVWTMHDYKLVCPAYICLRKNIVCEKCIDSLHNVLRYKCMKDSLLQSFFGYLESKFWNLNRIIKSVDCFIAPSNFMKLLMVKAGISPNKLAVLPHYISREEFGDVLLSRKDYYCFVGRFSSEKGIKNLVRVALDLPYKLLLVGDGPLSEELKEMSGNCENIIFKGFKEWDELKNILSEARFIVTPSEWYEVFGLVNIEAQVLGTPVLGANIGGIPETIEDGVTGVLFRSGDVDDLKEKIVKMFNMDFDYNYISHFAKEKFGEQRFYMELLKIYNKLD